VQICKTNKPTFYLQNPTRKACTPA